MLELEENCHCLSWYSPDGSLLQPIRPEVKALSVFSLILVMKFCDVSGLWLVHVRK